MSDFLSSIIGAAGPIAREVTVAGQTGTVYFRYLNGDQRLQLTRGKRYNVKSGESPTIEVDLGENEAEKHKLVHFCVVDAAGKQRFKDPASVKALEGHVIDALAAEVNALHKEASGKEETPGES
jgi:hypothetical protein